MTGRGEAGTGGAGRRSARLAWGLWALVAAGLVVTLGLDQALRRIGRPDLVSIGGDAVPYLLAMASAATVGAVLVGRRPRHPVGWLLLGLAVSVIVLGMSDAYASYGVLARPGSLPGARWAAIYVDSSWILLSTLLGFVLLLTPTGSLPSPRWRWWARLVVVAAVLALTVRTAPLDPRTRRSTRARSWSPTGPWPPRPGRSPSRPSSWSCSACRSRPARWWSGSVAPAGSSASSCAG
jgi:hypothetical protein